MFHFSMDVKDAMSVSGDELAENFIFEDEEFKKKIITKFINEHPDYKDKNSKSYLELESILDDEVFFKATQPNIRSIKKAIKLITDVFFFLPLRIWIGSREYTNY